MGQLTAGVDLGGTKIQTVVTRNREAVGSCRVLTPETGDADQAVWALALGVASAQNLLDLEAIVIGGELGDLSGAVGAAVLAGG